MNKQERAYDYLKFNKKWFIISSFDIIPILIILWLLNFEVVFYILLILNILGLLIYSEKIKKLERECGVR